MHNFGASDYEFFVAGLPPLDLQTLGLHFGEPWEGNDLLRIHIDRRILPNLKELAEIKEAGWCHYLVREFNKRSRVVCPLDPSCGYSDDELGNENSGLQLRILQGS